MQSNSFNHYATAGRINARKKSVSNLCCFLTIMGEKTKSRILKDKYKILWWSGHIRKNECIHIVLQWTKQGHSIVLHQISWTLNRQQNISFDGESSPTGLNGKTPQGLHWLKYYMYLVPQIQWVKHQLLHTACIYSTYWIVVCLSLNLQYCIASLSMLYNLLIILLLLLFSCIQQLLCCTPH